MHFTGLRQLRSNRVLDTVVLYRPVVLRPMEQTQPRASATMALPQHGARLIIPPRTRPERLILPQIMLLLILLLTSLHMLPELLTSRRLISPEPRISPLHISPLMPHLTQLLTDADDASGHVMTLMTYGYYPGGGSALVFCRFSGTRFPFPPCAADSAAGKCSI